MKKNIKKPILIFTSGLLVGGTVLGGLITSVWDTQANAGDSISQEAWTDLVNSVNNECSSDGDTNCFVSGEYTAKFNAPTICGTTSSICNSLYAYYTFESNGDDSSGNSINGTENGNITYNTGKINNCASFDNSTTYINYGNNFSFERTDSFTISAWIKTSHSGANQYILSKVKKTYVQNGWNFRIHSDGYLMFYQGGINPGNDLGVRTNTTVNDGNWHHVVITTDGTGAGGFKFYIDGVYQTSTTIMYNTLGSSTINTDNSNIGGVVDESRYSGNIDELAVWQRVFSASEISEIFTNNDLGKPLK